MAEKKNIWFLNHYAGNLTLGMEYRHFYLARHLRKLGHNVSIVSGSFHHLYTTPPDIAADADHHLQEFDGVPYCFLRTREYQGNGVQRLLGMLDYMRSVNRNLDMLEKEFGRPDMVLGSTPHPFVHFSLQKIRKTYGCPVFFEVRDLWPQMLIELGSLHKYHPLSLFFYWVERQAHQKSDRTVSLWHSADEYMLTHGLEKERYIYLPNGIELEESESTSYNLDHDVNKSVQTLKKQGKFVIGYGGSHGHANALDAVIDACKILQELGNDRIVFYCVGDGPERKRLITRAKDEGVFEQNLYFHDYVDKDVILGFYDLLDVAYIGLVDLPLFKYGPTPNKLMDYFSMVKPIIFAINSRYDPVAEAGAGVSIMPHGKALAKAAVTMEAHTDAERDAMGSSGRSYAERELSFEALAKKLEGYIVDACQN